ncbi:MAG: diguanylate cyclase [Pseudomonadota bacterium]
MKAHILLIEDSASQAEHTLKLLADIGYDTTWARGGLEGLKMAQTERPDLILLDVVMEDMDGYAVCRWLKMQEATRDTPVIMLTVRDEVASRVEGLNVGADDYLPKPFDARELEARIFAALRAKGHLDELKRRADDLEGLLHRVESMAITDALTGLYNRRRFSDVLRREVATARRYKNPLSCMLIDIDHFKRVNDAHGHDAGDKVLKGFSTLLLSNVREVDVPVRYGGEEFAVLMPQTSKSGALIVAERIRNRTREHSFDAGVAQVSFSLSIGIADVDDMRSDNEEELVLASDSALYQAKIQGRDRVHLYVAG